MEMDPDFALGMLKTISTFLDFFATIKFLKTASNSTTFEFLNLPPKPDSTAQWP